MCVLACASQKASLLKSKGWILPYYHFVWTSGARGTSLTVTRPSVSPSLRAAVANLWQNIQRVLTGCLHTGPISLAAQHKNELVWATVGWSPRYAAWRDVFCLIKMRFGFASAPSDSRFRQPSFEMRAAADCSGVVPIVARLRREQLFADAQARRRKKRGAFDLGIQTSKNFAASQQRKKANNEQ